MHARVSVLLAAAALVAGVATGRLFRGQAASRPAWMAEIFHRQQHSIAGTAAADSLRRPRTRRSAGSEITFSRAQWSQLVRNPRLAKVPVGDWLDATGQLERGFPAAADIPLIDRLTKAPPQYLGAQGLFFGWDERQTGEVRQALSRFGDELASAEKNGAQVEYPDGGGLRIDFSANQSQREEIADRLRDELTGILGGRDAERFALLSQMEGLARDLPPHYEIHDADIREVIVFTDPDRPEDGKDMVSHTLKPPLTDRFRHIENIIDWNRALHNSTQLGGK